MLVVSLFAAVLAGKNRTQTPEKYWSMWKDFQAIRWLDDMLTGQEHDDRFEIFKDGVDTIHRHNKEGHSWTMGVTPFTDMTPKEFKERVVGNYCDDHFQKNAKLNSAKTKLFEGRRRLNATGSVDWVTAGKVTGVKNQQSCGSCWAFSTTGSLESRQAISSGGNPISLSEQELVDCSTRDAGCNGGAMVDGFLYAEQHDGLCLESEYVYTATDGSCKATTCTHYDKPTTYTSVAYGESYLETAVKDGPVSVAIEADQSAFQYYYSGVFSGDCGTGLDHGVLIVGYDNDASEPYWIMKNSWGTGWGEQGYMRMCKNCGKNGNAGQCGVASDASYPVF